MVSQQPREEPISLRSFFLEEDPSQALSMAERTTDESSSEMKLTERKAENLEHSKVSTTPQISSSGLETNLLFLPREQEQEHILSEEIILPVVTTEIESNLASFIENHPSHNSLDIPQVSSQSPSGSTNESSTCDEIHPLILHPSSAVEKNDVIKSTHQPESLLAENLGLESCLCCQLFRDCVFSESSFTSSSTSFWMVPIKETTSHNHNVGKLSFETVNVDVYIKYIILQKVYLRVIRDIDELNSCITFDDILSLIMKALGLFRNTQDFTRDQVQSLIRCTYLSHQGLRAKHQKQPQQREQEFPEYRKGHEGAHSLPCTLLLLPSPTNEASLLSSSTLTGTTALLGASQLA